jgi:hypothetical protein
MTSLRTRLGIAVLLLAPLLSPAAAQKIFRCGPEGKTYSQTPCKDGYEVNANDQRSPEQRKAAEDVVKREAKLTETMAREREAKEAVAAKQAPTIIGKPPVSAPAAASAGAAGKDQAKAKAKRPVKPALQP